jgi:hypothetical protein
MLLCDLVRSNPQNGRRKETEIIKTLISNQILKEQQFVYKLENMQKKTQKDGT